MSQILEWTVIFMVTAVLAGVFFAVMGILASLFVTWDLNRRKRNRTRPKTP